MPQVSSEWVTTRQLAKVMRVNAEAAAVWHRARRFPQGAVKKVGRRLFWHLPSVQAWRDPGSTDGDGSRESA